MRSGTSRRVRVLVVASEPVDGPVLRRALGDEVREAEVMVISPALQRSRLKYWVGDNDEGIAHAEDVVEESIERLGEDGVDAGGEPADPDPLVAIEDALATFPADRIVVFSHPQGERDYREDELDDVDDDRFGVRVTHWNVTRG